MPEIQGVILAAGRGSRLGDAARDHPKCLLEIGGKRLVEHQLEALAEAGVGPTAMVLGYGAEEIREVVGMRAEYIHSRRWEATNSLYSFWMAREWVKGPVVVLNCDVLFPSAVLDRLLAEEGDVFAIDSTCGLGREAMKVKVDAGGRLLDMRKDLPTAEISGENVGVLKLTAETAQELFRRADALIAAGNEKQWLGAAVRDLSKEKEMRGIDVAPLPWVEIDFPVDLHRARKVVWPQIHGQAWRRRAFGVFVRWVALVILFVGGAFALRALWPEPPRTDWETVAVGGAKLVQVQVGAQLQPWWHLDKDGVARTPVQGPGRARIETRLLEVPESHTPYVIEAAIDGERQDWFKHRTRRSGKATYEGEPVGKKERTTIDIPPGDHMLEVRLKASGAGSVLVRVRQPEVRDPDGPPDPE
ncbi:MAG: phosphocholine cytidylyltransferase family protein [Planctomycetota bacterium]|jgi:choline kinase